MRILRAGIVLVLLMALAAGCGGSGASGSGADSGQKLQVSVTISVIGDLAERVGGDRVEVSTIVPVGGSPETFQPSPSDARRISEAQVLVQNGLGLDEWVGDLMRNAGREDQTVVELSRGMEDINGNPHLWLDVSNAERYVEKIRDALIQADPRGAREYRANTRQYLADMEKLDSYIEERAAGIPEERRKLVTVFDNVLPYFARAYGFELAATVLANPNAEPGSRETANAVRKIREESVPAVFTTPQFDPRLADTVAREAGVRVYEIYSDTVTQSKSGGTYEAMMRTNIDRIAEALR